MKKNVFTKAILAATAAVAIAWHQPCLRSAGCGSEDRRREP